MEKINLEKIEKRIMNLREKIKNSNKDDKEKLEDQETFLIIERNKCIRKSECNYRMNSCVKEFCGL